MICRNVHLGFIQANINISTLTLCTEIFWGNQCIDKWQRFTWARRCVHGDMLCEQRGRPHVAGHEWCGCWRWYFVSYSLSQWPATTSWQTWKLKLYGSHGPAYQKCFRCAWVFNSEFIWIPQFLSEKPWKENADTARGQGVTNCPPLSPRARKLQ